MRLYLYSKMREGTKCQVSLLLLQVSLVSVPTLHLSPPAPINKKSVHQLEEHTVSSVYISVLKLTYTRYLFLPLLFYFHPDINQSLYLFRV